MKGRTLDEARAQLQSKKLPEAEVERIAPHRVFSGNRPSLTLVHDKLDPFAFGRLIALYEHRVFVEAQIFGINAFDQWGVELGKELATELLPVVSGADLLKAKTLRQWASLPICMHAAKPDITNRWIRIKPGFTPGFFRLGMKC